MADQRIQHNEKMVGAGHPSLEDTLNRLSIVEHNNDGTHKYKQEIDIREYLPTGFVTDGSIDYTAQIQAAIDYGKSLGSAKVIFPLGTWAATSITRKSHVALCGVQRRGTKLLALPSASTGFFVTEPGPVLNSDIENLSVWGGNGSPVNAGQWAIFSEAVAQAASPYNGGEWYSRFHNVEILNFDNGIWFKAGDSAYLLPHQFITLDGVVVVRASDSGVALKLTGQCGQFVDINGRYDGKTKGLGTNIYIGRNGAGPNGCYSIHFHGTTSQMAERGFDIDFSNNINIFGANCESLYRAVRASAASAMVNVYGSKFADAGSDGASGGYVFQMGNSSTGTFVGNCILGTFDKIISNSNARGLRTYGNNIGSVSSLLSTHTSGMTVQKSVTAGPPVSLDLYSNSDILVNTSASVITQINSLLMPGELLFLKAYNGSVTLGTGGNITLGGAASVIVPQNAHALLKRADLAGTWELVAVSRAGSVAKLAPGTAASAAYVQAEAQATMNKIDSVIDALVTAGLMK